MEPEVNTRLDKIDEKLEDYNKLLQEHIARTAASEARLELMETFTKASLEAQQKNFDSMIQMSKDNAAALNRQIKILLGVFTGLAALVTALVAFLK